MANHLRASQSAHAKSTIHLCGVYLFLLLGYFIILFHHMLILNLQRQLVLRISGYTNNLDKNASKCKILIAPEEGWFGQPKYTFKKSNLRCVGFCLYIPGQAKNGIKEQLQRPSKYTFDSGAGKGSHACIEIETHATLFSW